jgi:thymidylate kinase
VSVALLGTDGAGKSTLAAAIQRSFYFPVHRVYMGLWQARQPRETTVLQRPGLRILGAALKLAGRMPLSWRGYLIGRCHEALGRVVIFDRYVYDALVTSQHTTGRLRRWYLRLLGHSCPAPDLVLVLDAPGEMMFARKAEHTPEILEMRRQELLAVSKHIPHVQIVDATRAESVVRADVLGRIWAVCCGR